MILAGNSRPCPCLQHTVTVSMHRTAKPLTICVGAYGAGRYILPTRCYGLMGNRVLRAQQSYRHSMLKSAPKCLPEGQVEEYGLCCISEPTPAECSALACVCGRCCQRKHLHWQQCEKRSSESLYMSRLTLCSRCTKQCCKSVPGWWSLVAKRRVQELPLLPSKTARESPTLAVISHRPS